MQADDIMSMKEVCAYLRVHPSTLYRMIKSGQLPHFKIGSDYRFRRQDILRWCEERIVGKTE